jgi:hypothetical protein
MYSRVLYDPHNERKFPPLPNSISRVIFVMVMQCAFCDLGTELLNAVQIIVRLQSVNRFVVIEREVILIKFSFYNAYKNVFACSNIWFVGSNPTWSIVVCLRFFCVGNSLSTDSSSPFQGVVPTLCKIHSFRTVLNGTRPEGVTRQKKKKKSAYKL